MQAEVGIAFGSGADIAIESADVIILNKWVGAVLDAYEISRYSHGKMLQNVILAFTFNGIGIPAAATGLVYPICRHSFVSAPLVAPERTPVPLSRLVPVDGGSLVSYFLPMIVFGLKVLLAIAMGLVITALL